MELTLSRLRTIVEKDFLIQPRLFDSVYQRKNRLNQTLTSGHFTYGSFRWIESHIEISNIYSTLFNSILLFLQLEPCRLCGAPWPRGQDQGAPGQREERRGGAHQLHALQVRRGRDDLIMQRYNLCYQDPLPHVLWLWWGRRGQELVWAQTWPPGSGGEDLRLAARHPVSHAHANKYAGDERRFNIWAKNLSKN